MSEPVKFTEEELKSIQDIQKKYFDIQGELGRISITRIRLNQQLDSLSEREDNLNEEFIGAQNEEKTFVDSINKKYGEGVLDPESGTFTPAKK
tara:strand:+ start:841 stop:1119 length:279 start_codon:yes stop_codon:yes gene_type:complete